MSGWLTRQTRSRDQLLITDGHKPVVARGRDLDSSLLKRKWIVEYLLRDCSNLIRFGRDAFLAGQRVWIVPREIRKEVRLAYSRAHTATIRGGSWDEYSRPVESNPVYSEMRRLLQSVGMMQVSGAEVQGFENLGLGTQDAARMSIETSPASNREGLLRLITDVRSLGRLRTREELGGFREFYGVYIHIGRTGEALFGRGGQHRFAIARLLDLPLIPAQIGIVHDCAVRNIGLRELQRMYC